MESTIFPVLKKGLLRVILISFLSIFKKLDNYRHIGKWFNKLIYKPENKQKEFKNKENAYNLVLIIKVHNLKIN